ncbi:hypothetical protein [Paracoccus zhejiangensis]|uniref:Uncharacterized protein n=1 Tax=Paracoccus zhejiangensis TaxID=1077935 RepID=A0A2H5EXE2_9RHOB|nr:hypothetical protein [Paracoccus zhejiangensis]AUH63976.1 hypothetical protein CX676_07200 [Paracoccus zhejiangensis]
MAFGVKEAGLIGVAALVGWFGTNLLPPHPGLELTVRAVGTVACIGGGAIGIAAAELKGWRLAVLAIIAVIISTLGIVGFDQIATGQPSENAALLLYVLSVLIFLPLGVLIQLAGLAV